MFRNLEAKQHGICFQNCERKRLAWWRRKSSLSAQSSFWRWLEKQARNAQVTFASLVTLFRAHGNLHTCFAEIRNIIIAVECQCILTSKYDVFCIAVIQVTAWGKSIIILVLRFRKLSQYWFWLEQVFFFVICDEHLFCVDQEIPVRTRQNPTSGPPKTLHWFLVCIQICPRASAVAVTSPSGRARSGLPGSPPIFEFSTFPTQNTNLGSRSSFGPSYECFLGLMAAFSRNCFLLLNATVYFEIF